MDTARLLQSGRSQAVRLPKEYRLPFDEHCVWAYADLEKRGQSIGSLDTMIAAHALALDATLVTRNTREFSRVAGLRLENWAESATP